MPSEIKTIVTRATARLTTRSAARFGDVIAFTKRNGELKKERILVLGSSDKHFGVKASNGELASSPLAKSDKQVKVVGQFNTKLTMFKSPDDFRKDFRSQLRVGDVYRAKNDGGKTYIHLGRVDDGRFLALNPESRDYATTRTPNKEVVVIGVAEFNAANVA